MCRAQTQLGNQVSPQAQPTLWAGAGWGSVVLRAFNSQAYHPIHEPAWELVDLTYRMGAQAP